MTAWRRITYGWPTALIMEFAVPAEFAATPGSWRQGRSVRANYRTMQNPWASMPRATLNLLRLSETSRMLQ